MVAATRAFVTLLGVAAAGFLVWLATQFGGVGDILEETEVGRYWSFVALLAAAGLALAMSQLAGGWTKWGAPRFSRSVFLLGFLPAFVGGGWVAASLAPDGSWFGDRFSDWSDDLGLEGLVADLGPAMPALAFGVGLVLGFVFDTTGPRRVAGTPSRDVAAAPPVASDPFRREPVEQVTAVRREPIEDDADVIAQTQALLREVNRTVPAAGARPESDTVVERPEPPSPPPR